jgi:hypothetical protein
MSRKAHKFVQRRGLDSPLLLKLPASAMCLGRVFLFWACALAAQVQAQTQTGAFFKSELILEKIRDPNSKQLMWVGVGFTALVTSADFQIRDTWQGHQQMSEEHEGWGDQLGTGIPSLVAALSQIYLDPIQGRNHLRSITVSTLATYGLKTLVGRRRPGGSSNTQSFPSGHTSVLMASATALTYSYGWRAAVMAYPLAVFSGMSRLAKDTHWASDVVGGAFVGVWSAYVASVETEFSEEFSQGFQWQILPAVVEQEQGLVLMVSFD